jgi:hypothetical protein
VFLRVYPCPAIFSIFSIVAAKFGYDLAENWSLSAGCRTLEGGADTDTIYTFAWLHYAAFSIAYRF